MPGQTCLLPHVADELARKFKDGELDMTTLAAMSSAERRAALSDVVGESGARQLNAAFESKLLLKNQQKGLESWVRSLTDVPKATKRDLLSRVQRMDRVLDPKERAGFLEDLAHQKLGYGLTMDEAAKVTTLSKNVTEAKARQDWPAYMDARATFHEYMGTLAPPQPTTIAAIARAGVLTAPKVFAKLSAMALSRAIITPATDAVALGVANVLPELAEGAPRYGMRSPTEAMKAQAAGVAAMWRDGMRDAWRVAKNQPSKLDLMHDEHATPHKWFDYSGSLHSAIKKPVEWMEYGRSMYRRLADAAAQGQDVNDIDVRLQASLGAFKDAKREISMQDNVGVSAWNAGLRRLEQANPETGKPSPVGKVVAGALRIESPIVKIPSNLVAETSEFIGGLPVGAGRVFRALWTNADGLNGLKPVERDAIIRQISKGSIGAGVMALYFFKHEMAGGLYVHGEKRKSSDIPEGATKIGDVTVPKLFQEHPLFQAAQFAATTAKVANLPSRSHDPNGLAWGTFAAALGLIDELPFAGSLPHDVGAAMDQRSAGEFFAKKFADLAVPGAVRWIATQTDPAPKRAPKGLTQHLEANIPGLRESVPTTKRKR